MSPNKKDPSSSNDDPVSEFLARENEAIQAIEEMAISARVNSRQPVTKSMPSSMTGKEITLPPIDWDNLEKIISSVELDFEAAHDEAKLAFLVEEYKYGGTYMTDYWKGLMEAHEKRIVEQRAAQAEYLTKTKLEAGEFFAQIEAEEKTDYEEGLKELKGYYHHYYRAFDNS